MTPENDNPPLQKKERKRVDCSPAFVCDLVLGLWGKGLSLPGAAPGREELPLRQEKMSEPGLQAAPLPLAEADMFLGPPS